MSYPQMSNGHAPTSSSLAKSRFDTLLAKQPPIAEADVAEVFDDLPSIKPGVLIGEWDGHSLDTGHPGHAKLTAMRWAGKTFRGVDDADPIVVLNDAGQRVVGKAWGQSSLREVQFRGKLSAAMIYDEKPIIDIFRGVDDDTVIGAMDCPKVMGSNSTYYFFLTRRS